MSTQIDPLTGLPMVFDSIIEQIPLDAQIFPYADLGATARPTAPPLYPDSIIPVSAFLSGQHPDTGSAQTVETDGQHALLVKSVGGAGGGGFIATNYINVSAVNQSLNANAGGVDNWNWGSVATGGYYIVGASVTVMADIAGTVPATGKCSFQLTLQDIPVFTNYWVAGASFSWGAPAPALGELSATAYFTPSVPLPFPVFNATKSWSFEWKSDCDLVYTAIWTLCQKA